MYDEESHARNEKCKIFVSSERGNERDRDARIENECDLREKKNNNETRKNKNAKSDEKHHRRRRVCTSA